MPNNQSNISHMQCWLFRLAQSKWELTPADTIALFKRFGIFEYISDCYDILHLSSYHHALNDIEMLLAHNGITVFINNKTSHRTNFSVSFDNQKGIYSTTVSDEAKEACAIETMHCMVLQYAADHRISFGDAFFAFATSTTYQALFDFDTAVWKDGPEYIRSLFEKALAMQYSQ